MDTRDSLVNELATESVALRVCHLPLEREHGNQGVKGTLFG